MANFSSPTPSPRTPPPSAPHPDLASPPTPPPTMSVQHDTTLRLSLTLPGVAAHPAAASSPRTQAARRTRPEGAVAAPVLARARGSPTGEAPPCTECGKMFPSWKALFGHMRCHPEREWRGITPPRRIRQEAGGASGATAAIQLDQFTQEDLDAAGGLVMLSRSRPAAAGGGDGKGKGKKIVASAAPPHHPAPKVSCCAAGTSAPAAASAMCDDHKCTVCHRGFTSGQALGGHKRRHWERSSVEMVAVATAYSSTKPGTPAEASPAANATALDLNMPPPVWPQKKMDQGGDLKETLDLKLGLNS